VTKSSRRLLFQLGFNPAGLLAWLIMDGPTDCPYCAITRGAAEGSLAKTTTRQIVVGYFHDASMKSDNFTLLALQ
jgi:hypothetical protein